MFFNVFAMCLNQMEVILPGSRARGEYLLCVSLGGERSSPMKVPCLGLPYVRFANCTQAVPWYLTFAIFPKLMFDESGNLHIW